jgi:hypothetical protein
VLYDSPAKVTTSNAGAVELACAASSAEGLKDTITHTSMVATIPRITTSSAFTA